MMSTHKPSPAGIKTGEDHARYLASAIVSTYKSGAFIGGCLENLLNQTIYLRGELEIIVIDSGSPENEGEIVRRYQACYSHIRYIRTERRETIYQAWNRGITAARGKYITNANTDDRHRPDALEVMARELDTDPSAALVYADVFVTGFPHGTFHDHIRCGYHIRPDYAPEIMQSGCHMGPQPMWRRSLHDELGMFSEELVSAGDYEFWCRIATRHTLKHIAKFLGLYFENPAGICNSDNSRVAHETHEVKNMYRDFFPTPGRSFSCNYQWLEQAEAGRYVNICMITFNRLEFTRQAVDGLVRFTRFPHVLTVVDNASTDGTREYLLEMKKLGIIKNLVLLEENVGVAKATNLAWSMQPEAEYYLKLDNDIVIKKPDWLEGMVSTSDAVLRLGAVAFNFEPKSYPLTFVNGYGIRRKDYGNLGGACILIPKRTERLLGCWCEDYGLYSEEDADYGFRIRYAGLWNAYMEDERIGVHLPAGRAASIDLHTLTASDGVEEYQHAEYRKWKDEQRKLNIGEDGMFTRNIRAYRNGTKPLRVESAFVREHAGNHVKLLTDSKGAGDMALLIRETAKELDQKKDFEYLVTAIVSTYNSEQFIRECLEDLENQNIAEKLEIIVVDAASPQAEGAIVADFQKRYSNITYIRTASRIGVYPAWNIAIKLARGKYISPFSTNDRLSKDAYEAMVDALERNQDAALVYGDSYHTKIPHETFEKHTRCGSFQWPDYSYDDLLRTCMIGPHPMWRKSVHDSVGFFDESFVALGDQDFFLRVGALFNMLHIPRFTGLYWLSEDGLSNREEIYAPELRRIRNSYGTGISGKTDLPVSYPDTCNRVSKPDIERLRRLAAKEIEENRLDEALTLLRQARNAGDTSVLADMGDCLAMQDKLDEAMGRYNEAIFHDACDSKARIGAGVINILKQKFPEAAHAFAEALEMDPENPKALCGLGMARYGQGFKKAGARYFVKTLNNDPENITALNELVKAAYDMDEFAEAISYTRNYLMYHPGDLDVLFSFGGVLYKSGKYGEAQDALERLLALSPEYLGGRELLAKILTEKSHVPQHADSPVSGQQQSETPETFIEQGRMKKEEGKFDEAFVCFGKALELGDSSVLSDMGDCKANLGDCAEAERLYEEGLRHDPENIGALVGTGILQLLQGKHVKAVASFNKVLKLEPANAKALCGLGMVRNVQGKHKDALKCFSRALDADPENLPALHELVKCAYGLDRFDEAEKHLSAYLTHHPGDLDMQFSLAGVRFKIKNYRDALENVENLLAFAPEYSGGEELRSQIMTQLAANG